MFIATLIPSYPELIVLLVLVLLLFGAKKLPELARGLGQSVNEFKKAKDEFDKEIAKSASPDATSTTPTQVQTPVTPPENKGDQKQS